MKEVIKHIEDFCNEHVQINEFGCGPLSMISTKNHKFPIVWLLPTNARHESSHIILGFDMLVFDLLKSDYTNLTDILNDCQLIGRDIIAYFSDTEYEYGFAINETANSEPFDFKFDDICAGWIFKIEVELVKPLNICAIPTIDEPQPTPPCQCPEGVKLYNIIEYGNNSVTFDSDINFFRRPDDLTICCSDSSDGTYTAIDGSYIIGGELGYLFTFILDSSIYPSNTNLGKLYI